MVDSDQKPHNSAFEEQKSREVMVSLEKAIAEHTLHSGDLDKALELWNQLLSSEDLSHVPCRSR